MENQFKKFTEYLIKANTAFHKENKKTISINDVDLSEENNAGMLMGFYIEMIKEKLIRKSAYKDEKTFELSGMSEDEKYIYESIAGTYVYENQFDRKEIRETIAELTSLSLDEVEKIAMANLGEDFKAVVTDKDREDVLKYVKQEDEPTK